VSKKEQLLTFFQNNYYELLLTMSEIQHGYNNTEKNPYHKEGDIWTHTKMVIDQVDKRYKDNIDFLTAALLHDIGKIYTFEDNDETKKRSFKGHEGVSFFLAQDIIENIRKNVDGFKKLNSKRILKIIALHGRLYQEIKENNIERVSDMFINDKLLLKDLKNFFLCDSYGRITDERKDEEEVIEFFNNAISYGKKKQKTFKNKLVILSGLPRGGKSFWREQFLQSNKEFVIISRDDILCYIARTNSKSNLNYNESWKYIQENELNEVIDKELLKLYQTALKNKKDIIVDMTNMSKKARKKFITQAKQKKYKIESKVITTPIQTCVFRNNKEKNIDVKVMLNMAKRFVFPLYDEVDSINIILGRFKTELSKELLY